VASDLTAASCYGPTVLRFTPSLKCRHTSSSLFISPILYYCVTFISSFIVSFFRNATRRDNISYLNILQSNFTHRVPVCVCVCVCVCDELAIYIRCGSFPATAPQMHFAEALARFPGSSFLLLFVSGHFCDQKLPVQYGL
jgi:hypothetical protein